MYFLIVFYYSFHYYFRWKNKPHDGTRGDTNVIILRAVITLLLFSNNSPKCSKQFQVTECHKTDPARPGKAKHTQSTHNPHTHTPHTYTHPHAQTQTP